MTGPPVAQAPVEPELADQEHAEPERVGVLVMAHGTPATPDEIEPFYTRIRRGRPPTPEQLADLRRRYDAIGGTSPLAARTDAQVAGIAARLHRARPGRFDVRYGAKHTEPSIEEAAAGLVGRGVDRVVGLVLAPHRSSLGSEEYLERAAAEIGRLAPDVPFVPVRQWFDAPGFADLLADRVLAALSSLPADRGNETIVFTAHSLPERVVAAGDPYPEQLTRSAELVVDRAGLADSRQRDAGVTWQVAWQSAGRTPDPWLGPDILDVIRGLPAAGAGAVVVCPIGFVADHLEILYDLDVEARAVADAAGVAFVRTASLNDDARFLDVLARVVEDAAEMVPPDGPDATGPPAGSTGPTNGATKDRRLRPRTIAVVGAGIAGLAAAWELSGGREGPGPGTPAVVVLEASPRVGGKLRTESFGGRPVDVGPDGFLGRRPEAAELCREVGLGDDLEPIGAAGAAVWSGGRRRALPAGQLLGVPTRFLPVARSGILGLRGNIRLLVDVLAPRPDLRGPLGDRAIGPLVAKKLGRRVVDRLVDPLVGGIYAGGVDDVSAAAAHPVLLAASQGRAGLMRSLRRSQAGPAAATGAAAVDPTGDGPGGPSHPAPAFWALRGGLGTLVDRLVAVLTDRGVTVRTDCAVDRLDRGAGGGPAWSLRTADGDVAADAVVIAVPAAPAADLLAAHDADTAALLRAIDYSSVALVTLAYPDGALGDGLVGTELVGTGLLVPRHSPLPAALADQVGVGRKGDDGSFMVTACSYLSRKWPHLARPGELLLRASVGRFEDRRFTALSDEQLVARVAAEVGVLLGIDGAPTTSSVTRWADGLPQYRVHHLLRVTGIEAAVKRLPGLAVAGAAYRGVGVPACVASGRAAGRAVLTALGLGPDPANPGPAGPGPVSPGP